MVNEFRNSGSIICEPGNLAENGEENHYKTYLMKKKINWNLQNQTLAVLLECYCSSSPD